jgi:hypothetical protein
VIIRRQPSHTQCSCVRACSRSTSDSSKVNNAAEHVRALQPGSNYVAIGEPAGTHLLLQTCAHVMTNARRVSNVVALLAVDAAVAAHAELNLCVEAVPPPVVGGKSLPAAEASDLSNNALIL